MGGDHALVLELPKLRIGSFTGPPLTPLAFADPGLGSFLVFHLLHFGGHSRLTLEFFLKLFEGGDLAWIGAGRCGKWLS
jgi:hypothetical protein